MFIRSLTIFIMMKDHLYYLHVLKNIWMNNILTLFVILNSRELLIISPPGEKGSYFKKSRCE